LTATNLCQDSALSSMLLSYPRHHLLRTLLIYSGASMLSSGKQIFTMD